MSGIRITRVFVPPFTETTRVQTSPQPKGMGGKLPPLWKPDRSQYGSVLCAGIAEETETVPGVGGRVPVWLPWLLEATEGHILHQKVAFHQPSWLVTVIRQLLGGHQYCSRGRSGHCIAPLDCTAKPRGEGALWRSVQHWR